MSANKVEHLSEFISELFAIILKQIPAERALAVVFDNTQRIVFRKGFGFQALGNGDFPLKVLSLALNVRHPVLISDLRADSNFKTVRDVQENVVSSILCYPLFLGSMPVGALYLDRCSRYEPFSFENLELLGALSKPLEFFVKRAFAWKASSELKSTNGENSFIGQSQACSRIKALIEKVKDTDAPVFVLGESGTGKELIARAIHSTGARRKGKFIAVNCGAIPDHLLESELFGYVRGAFTGAWKDKAGLIEEAHGGTFFLDEVGDLSPHLQAKLLRLLQEKEIRRVGENRLRYVNVRFISATNKNIEKEIERGNFRQDLYYRLRIITIEVPPLRERKEDILLLLNHFLEKYCQEMQRERVHFSPPALELLLNYSWPGNVRELQNELQRCLILCGESSIIRPEHLSPKIFPQGNIPVVSSDNFFEAKAQFEKRFLSQALLRHNFNKSKTAEEIGLSRQGLFKLLKKHKIEARA